MRLIPNKIRKISRCGSRSSVNAELGHFHLAATEDGKKCINNYNRNAREQPFCSLNLFFGDVLVAIAVLFCQ